MAKKKQPASPRSNAFGYGPRLTDTTLADIPSQIDEFGTNTLGWSDPLGRPGAAKPPAPRPAGPKSNLGPVTPTWAAPQAAPQVPVPQVAAPYQMPGQSPFVQQPQPNATFQGASPAVQRAAGMTPPPASMMDPRGSTFAPLAPPQGAPTATTPNMPSMLQRGGHLVQPSVAAAYDRSQYVPPSYDRQLPSTAEQITNEGLLAAPYYRGIQQGNEAVSRSPATGMHNAQMAAYQQQHDNFQNRPGATVTLRDGTQVRSTGDQQTMYGSNDAAVGSMRTGPRVGTEGLGNTPDPYTREAQRKMDELDTRLGLQPGAAPSDRVSAAKGRMADMYAGARERIANGTASYADQQMIADKDSLLSGKDRYTQEWWADQRQARKNRLTTGDRDVSLDDLRKDAQHTLGQYAGMELSPEGKQIVGKLRGELQQIGSAKSRGKQQADRYRKFMDRVATAGLETMTNEGTSGIGEINGVKYRVTKDKDGNRVIGEPLEDAWMSATRGMDPKKAKWASAFPDHKTMQAAVADRFNMQAQLWAKQQEAYSAAQMAGIAATPPGPMPTYATVQQEMIDEFNAMYPSEQTAAPAAPYGPPAPVAPPAAPAPSSPTLTPAVAAPSQGAAPASGIPKVTTAAEFAAVPPGSFFMDAAGNVRGPKP